jgi:hypothetical protein
MENNMTTDLLTQLNTLITNAESNQADAERWHHLITLLGALGYGPRITPDQIAELVPNIHGLQELSAATQETVPTQPAGSKMSRRKLTVDDKRALTTWKRAGGKPERIAKDLGISLSAVEKFFDAAST